MDHQNPHQLVAQIYMRVWMGLSDIHYFLEI